MLKYIENIEKFRRLITRTNVNILYPSFIPKISPPTIFAQTHNHLVNKSPRIFLNENLRPLPIKIDMSPVCSLIPASMRIKVLPECVTGEFTGDADFYRTYLSVAAQFPPDNFHVTRTNSPLLLRFWKWNS